jgi:hypothetical protein
VGAFLPFCLCHYPTDPGFSAAMNRDIEAATADMSAMEQISDATEAARKTLANCPRLWRTMQYAIWKMHKRTVDQLLPTVDLNQETKGQLNDIFSSLLVVLRRVTADVSSTGLN